MSKYIRTTDGIVEATQTVRCSNAVKRGETIEELCDWYVTFYSKDGHTEHCTYYDLDRDLFQSLIRAKNFTIYAAIWTSKGLIYVAKMNEKGEFELL